MMDAQKIKFMLSIQKEIDKLVATLGATHPDVIAAKGLFEKLSQDEMTKPSFSDCDCAEEIKPIKKDTETIIDQVKRVTQKFDLIDKEIEERAKHFYIDFPTTTNNLAELKKVLIKSRELFELSLKKEDHRLASKYAIVQLEGLLNLFETELINWEEENPTREYSQKSFIQTYNGIKSMPFRAKCNSIRAFLQLKYVDYNKISLVYDIRNYESHQLTGERIVESEIKLTQLKNSPTHYYEEVYKLMKQCFKSIK